ncbi:TetR/AcrR family transcriptional regulator [Noviherbaspirillum sp. Root189]|uniref:TetR/AcrR family transcriptional regulator n=1 Tax=Noviherbaspirillum sp. Root189 TaxID=1736487 RepID=UPI0019104173|nr:TetR/AcrR family transcriptional regulator [Noviherbaspirillum sp. Root189]
MKTSGALAKKNGFSASGVDALMEAAGLTSGAFYNHFGSKAELFTELIAQELDHSLNMIAVDKTEHTGKDWTEYQLRRYLTWKHVQSPQSGCAIPSLGAEVARADKATKKKFEEALKRAHEIWASQVNDDKIAWAAIAQLVGAILLARAMATEKTGKEVLEASKEFLEKAMASQDVK